MIEVSIILKPVTKIAPKKHITMARRCIAQDAGGGAICNWGRGMPASASTINRVRVGVWVS
jgi:hypothetical protein